MSAVKKLSELDAISSLANTDLLGVSQVGVHVEKVRIGSRTLSAA